jgi:hypothetical protein
VCEIERLRQNQPEPTGRHNWLLAGWLEIDDGEPTVGKAQGLSQVHPNPFAIRPPMTLGVGYSAKVVIWQRISTWAITPHMPHIQS